MLTTENTTGYTEQELDALNEELTALLVGQEPGTDDWYEIEKQFADTVARR